MATHLAALLTKTGSPLTLTPLPTPTPSATEVLIRVSAVALNPVDHKQRDAGFPPLPLPSVLGCDVSGTIASLGSSVPSVLVPGARVAALATSFWNPGSLPHGSFQEYVLVPWQCVVPLPESVGLEEGAMMPLATLTALTGWGAVGMSLEGHRAGEKEAVLVWGGASSVGTVAVQAAKGMGFRVYVTASERNHAYVKGLGADEVFDYTEEGVVDRIVQRVKEDGVVLRMGYCAAGEGLRGTVDALALTRGAEEARVASASLVPKGFEGVEGVVVTFVMPPLDKGEREEHFRKVFHGWLKGGLEKGTVVPSPKVQIEEGGLEGLDRALDVLRKGVSGVKIVVRL
ncbi:hypothetical protein B9Z65_4890 [Elsinoe australis]|uniref:Enoyl reductase (ER) domain-containing protein n=1 Tax=Elsinoe australis TaxID=40998 RepID=A0A2P8A6B6_9PEZI|nr:hypothetical protein B9Z65_4890 [Elsinoe australis]